MIRSFEDLKSDVTYLNGKSLQENVQPKNPAKWWHGLSPRSSSAPSPLYCWWFQEAEKQRRGQLNEHDNAEIVAAIKGFKNKWSQIVIDNPELFRFIDSAGPNEQQWQKIKDLRKKTS